MPTRIKSIRALLDKAEVQLETIEGEYNKSLHNRVIDDSLRIDIKNICENLRSVLDYLAHDIRERYCPSESLKDRFYFPILPDKKTFNSKLERWFPGLRQNAPTIVAALEAIQPYQSGYEWLGQFSRLNNENKHGDLVEQVRTERQETRVTNQKGGQVSWTEGVTFSKGVYVMGVPIDPKTQLTAPHPSIEVKKITWADFQFNGIGTAALGLLKRTLSGTKKIVATLQPLL